MSHHRNNDSRNNYRPEPEQGYGYPPLREDYQPKDRRDRAVFDDRGRDGGRERDRDRDRERRRDRSRDRRRSRSRSESPPVRTGRRRPTFFDILPAGMTPGAPPPPAVLPGAQPNLAAAAAFAAPPPSLAPMMGNPAAPGPPGFGAAAGSNAAVSQQATRHARRIYVGGLPPTATDTSISSFFGHALAAIGGNTAGPGNAVVNVYINREKNFAFVELRTVEETSNAMALDGIMFEGVSVRVRRPNDYNPAAAASLGPSTPNPNLNLAAIGLSNSNVGGGGGGGGGKPSHIDHPDRIFVGGLPYHLTEEQCRELLGSFGAIKAFDLVKDRDTGLGKGYGFVVYQDSAVTDIACAGLNGLRIGDRTLTVRRATEGPQAQAASAGAAAGAGGLPAGLASIPGLAINPMVAAAAATALGGGIAGATRIVVLTDAVSADEIADPNEYEDILQDMREEAGRHGLCNNVLIPRPTPENPNPPGMCKVVMEFNDVSSAAKARTAMHGRRFAGRVVNATYLTEEAYFSGRYDG